MIPSLPQNDPSEARADQLEDARRIYGYTYNWPPDVAVAAAVPRSDTYSPSYIAKLVPIVFELFENNVEMTGLMGKAEELGAFVTEEMAHVATLGPPDVGHWFFDVHTRLADHVTSQTVPSVGDYGDLFAALPAVPVWGEQKWNQDDAFAWQRIAGANPMTIEVVRTLPEGIRIDQSHWNAALGCGSMADALAAGTVFACDYGLLDGVACGVTNGRQKYMHGPYALFAAVEGKLKPVAIQLSRKANGAIFTPDQGDDWQMAKLAVQVADASIHETMMHLGRTHMVMEACTLATHRQLANVHPIHVLLMPHCAYTLPINHSAATSLIAPNGTIDKAFGPTITACAGLVRHALDTWPLDRVAPAINCADRGLTADVLPEMPYRDDAILVWDAIEAFVTGYVQHYYATDADVAADAELAAWVAELEGPCRLTGVNALTDRAGLAQLVSTFIFTASAQHAAVNFTQYPYMGAIPNMAGAFWQPWPGPFEMHEVLPPPNMAVLQFNTVYQLSSLRLNWLGQYPEDLFQELEIQALVKDLQADLLRIEATINEREKDRYLPYPHLKPSLIPASIHI